MNNVRSDAGYLRGLSRFQVRATSLAVTSALLLVATADQTAHAITITIEYTDEGDPVPHDENPAWDPAGTILKQHFTRAKQIWEQMLPGPGDFEFDFHWDDDIDDDPNDGVITLGLATQVGIDTFIEINPLAPWYADPFPANDDEFNPVGTQLLVSNLSAAQKEQYFPSIPPPPDALETGYFRPGNSTAIGAGGYDSQTGFDLLTVVVHEIGHILGIDGRVPNFYFIDAEHLGGTNGTIVAGGDGGHLAGNAATPGFLMCHSCAVSGGRYYPSATEILVIAQANEISDVSLQRIGRITSGNWTDANAWIGGDLPTPPKDVYIANGQNVTVNVDAGMRDLLVTGGSSLAVGDRILSSGGILDFKGAVSLSTTPGGIIYANRITRGATDLAAVAGSTVMFNSYEGGTGTTANFNARVVIGTGSGAGHSFDPTTITTWTFAGGLEVGSFGRTAHFIVDNGMTVTSPEGKLGTGSLTDSSGVVTVSGSNMSTGDLSKWTVNGPLTVASGQMIVSQDAEVSSASGSVGTLNGEGSVQVFTGGLWNVSNDLTIGPNLPGGTGRGYVTVRNDGDLWVNGNVFVRGSVAASSELVVASGGYMSVDGDVKVSPYGIVSYFHSTKAHAGVLGAETFENLGGADDSSPGGITRFYDTATAGNAKFTNRPGNTFFAGAGETRFYGNSTAGNDTNGHGTFDNYPGAASLFGGATRFFDFASAGRGKFYNHPGPSPLINATVEFRGDSTGANGEFHNLAGIPSQSSGGAIIFRDRAKAGYGTYTSEGEGGTVTFYNDSSAEHGTFSTADNIGGNSRIQFFGTSKGDHGTFTIRANTYMQFYENADAQHATITIKGAKPGFGTSGGVLSASGGTLGDAPVTVEGAADTGYYGGHVGIEATAGNATIKLLGGTALNAGGGTLRFDYGGSAGTATIEAFGGTNQGLGGIVEFARGANGPNSKVTIHAGATLDVGGNRINGGTDIGLLEGAGRFALNGSELRTGGLNADTIISGQILDVAGTNPDGRLTKVGTGTLTLAGSNTYTGLTTINAGTLIVTGSLAGGAVVNTAGTLQGPGNIAGTVINNGGTIAPGTSPGTLTIGGLQLNAGSHLQFELGTIRDHIVLTGGGNIQLGGTLDLIALAGFDPALNTTIPLFEGAIGSIAGTFAAVNAPVFNGNTVNVVYSENSVTLQIVDAATPPGDFNGNGAVDAADYVVWRKGLGTTYTPADYDTWRAQFGQSLGGGSASTTIPEPAVAGSLVATMVCSVFAWRQRRKSRLISVCS